jgi:hypothetical protein
MWPKVLLNWMTDWNLGRDNGRCQWETLTIRVFVCVTFLTLSVRVWHTPYGRRYRMIDGRVHYV